MGHSGELECLFFIPKGAVTHHSINRMVVFLTDGQEPCAPHELSTGNSFICLQKQKTKNKKQYQKTKER